MNQSAAYFPNRTTIPVNLAEALDEIVARLWQKEKKDFIQKPMPQKKGHIFTSLSVVKEWLEEGEYVE